MDRLHEVAQYVVASMRLADDDEKFATSHGAFDHALEEAIKNSSLPDWILTELHFVNGRTGRKCVELKDILDWAQMLNLTQAPNPTYVYTHIRFGPDAARRILSNLGVDVDAAKGFGARLRKALNERLAETEQQEPLEIFV